MHVILLAAVLQAQKQRRGWWRKGIASRLSVGRTSYLEMMTIYEDDVLREVWCAKEKLAAVYQYDVCALAKALRAKQGQDARQVVSLEPRRPIAATKRRG